MSILAQSFILFICLGCWYLVDHFHWLSLIQFAYIVLALTMFIILDVIIVLSVMSIIDIIGNYSWANIKKQLPVVFYNLKIWIAYAVKFPWICFIFDKLKFIAILCSISIIISGYKDLYYSNFNKFFALSVLAHLMFVSIIMFIVSHTSRDNHIEHKKEFDKLIKYVEIYIIALNSVLMLFVLTYFFTVTINSDFNFSIISNLFDTTLFFVVSLLTINTPKMLEDIQKNKLKFVRK